MSLSATQIDRLNNLSPSLLAAGLSLGTWLDQVAAELTGGNLGIESASHDVDSIARGGGCFSVDPEIDLATLTFKYLAGRAAFAGTVVEVAAGSVALSANQTNYIEVNSAGTVSKSTSGWTAGRVRLFKVTTGSSTISTISQEKVLAAMIAPASVTGSLLSEAAGSKQIAARAGTIAAIDATIVIPLPDCAGTITRIALVVTTTLAASDTDYWTFGVVNKGTDGSGTAVVVNAATAANSTKVTGGAGLTNFGQRELTLTGVGADLETAAGETLLLTCTKAASAANLVALTVLVEMAFVD